MSYEYEAKMSLNVAFQDRVVHGKMALHGLVIVYRYNT